MVTAMGRSAAFRMARARRARGHEVDVLLRSAELLDRPFDQRRVADEAVRAAADSLVTNGRRPVRVAVLVRVAGDVATVLAAGGEAATRIDLQRRLARAQLPAA